MIHLMFSLLLMLDTSFKINFTKEALPDWYIIDDGVMGGLSKGHAVFTEGGLLFYGQVSLENNGGFTSLRAPYGDYDLGRFTQVTIKYRSKGVKMALQLENDRRFYYPNFKLKLPNRESWGTETYLLEDVLQYRMGYATGNKMEVTDQSEIIRLGFITDEKKTGTFEFEVAYLEFE